MVNWTLVIPKGSCTGCSTTNILFNFFGILTKGTNASYTVVLPFNNTKVPGGSGNFTGPQSFPNFVSKSCPEIFCIDVTRYVGFNLTLSFRFGWNSSETGMTVDAGEIVVAARNTTPVQSSSNYMMLNSTDTSKVTHIANLSLLNYNSSVSYRNPQSGQIITHIWSMEILNIFYPLGYTINSISLNSSKTLFPTLPGVPFETCNSPSACSQALIALNMSDFVPLVLRNSTVAIRATTQNTISLLSTLVSSVPVSYFVPGDQLSVRVVNAPSASVSASLKTGKLNVTFVDPRGFSRSLTPLVTSTISGGVYNFTVPTSPLGLWSINATFASGFDLGVKSTTFTVQQIGLVPSSFSYIGSNTLLTVRGNLSYASNGTPAASINATVFAVDAASEPGPITTTNSFASGLYIQNITLVNGVFTGTQPLTMFFTVINPTPAQGFTANLTIQQEWQGSQTHGASANVTLDLGDQPFTFGPRVYRADIILLPSGMQITVTSLTTQNKKTVTGSLGVPPLVPSRQHAGLFKVAITSKQLPGTLTYSNLLESPTYAYLSSQAAAALIPSRLLAFKSFVTAPDGTFSATLASNRILAAKKLVLFVLARDANGIVLGNQDPTASTDNTLLQSSLEAPSEVAVRQSVAPKVHLRNNSTKITFSLTINLDLGSGTVASQTAVLPPGGQQDLPFTFTAPSSPGVYVLTFSSPEYGAPLLTKTLQVSLLQSNLQILIPAIIGLVAALVILGFYLVRKSPEVAPETKEKQRPSSGKPSKPQTGQPSSKSLTRT